MKKLIILFLSLMLAGPALTYLQAQQIHASVNTSGGNASGTGGSVSYSVGQVFNTTAFGTNGSVSEGVQQPFEISVFTGLKDNEAINLFFAAYPNPTKGNLTLKIENFETNTFSYQLCDVNGKIIRNEKLTEKISIVDLSDMKSGAYFIKVTNNRNAGKTFKIIKH